MKYMEIAVAVIVALFLTWYGFKSWQADHTEIDTSKVMSDIDGLETPDSINTMVENVETFNQQATRDFELLKQKAKSEPSRKFIALTEQQNALATQGQTLLKEMQPLINSMTPEIARDPERSRELFVPFCTHLKSYIPILSGIIEKISTKQQLLIDNPDISTELFDGQNDKMNELITHLLQNQTRIYEEEKQAYKQLKCDSYLPHNQATTL